MEEARYDPDNGQLLSASFMDYAVPRAADLPRFDVVMREVLTNPLGALRDRLARAPSPTLRSVAVRPPFLQGRRRSRVLSGAATVGCDAHRRCRALREGRHRAPEPLAFDRAARAHRAGPDRPRRVHGNADWGGRRRGRARKACQTCLSIAPLIECGARRASLHARARRQDIGGC